MTEKGFWQFLGRAWKKGRVSQMSMVTDSSEPKMQVAGEYTGEHVLLPQDYDKISKEEIFEISQLLFAKEVGVKTKEAVMMILAHQNSKEALIALKKYSMLPDRGLEIFAELALSECEMWNEKEHD